MRCSKFGWAPVIAATMLVVLFSATVQADTISSFADGYYDVIGTWGAGAGPVPTVGDTALIDHNVQLDYDKDITTENSWDVDVVQINSGGEFDVKFGEGDIAGALIFNGGTLNSSGRGMAEEFYPSSVTINDVPGNIWHTTKNKRDTLLTTPTLSGSGTWGLRTNWHKGMTLTIADTTGFTGLLDVEHSPTGGEIIENLETQTAFLRLTNGIAEADGSFGIELKKVIYDWSGGEGPDDGTAYSAYDMTDENDEVWVTSLTIDAFSVAPRDTAYTYAELAAMDGGNVALFLKTDGTDGTLGVVPEPGTLVLLLSGGLGLVLWRRRR